MLQLLAEYDMKIEQAVTLGINISDKTEMKQNVTRDWDFWTSLFFSATIYTSIGTLPMSNLRHAYSLPLGFVISVHLFDLHTTVCSSSI